jgi:hypothetical protein
MPQRQGWVQIRADEYERLRVDTDRLRELLKECKRDHDQNCSGHCEAWCAPGGLSEKVTQAVGGNPATLF